MTCSRCGASTWNYNVAAGTRMCVNGHMTGADGVEVPYTPTYVQARVPVAVPPPEPVIVQGIGARLVAAMIVGAIALTEAAERLIW